MSEDFYLELPISKDKICELRAGDYVYLTGTIYSARDAAHERMFNTLGENGELPFDIRDAFIYYLGPTPAKPGQVIGSAGPTTSSRMDKYTPLLLDKGLKGMIGKGRRNDLVRDAIVRNKAIYLAAVGGAGALLSKCITKSEVIAYDDLGTEAIRRMEVKNFPAIVIIDTKGKDLYSCKKGKYIN